MNRKLRQPRGIALLLVVAVLALVSALSYAMLSSAALSNRTGGNQTRLVTADYLVESGINLALYYLQNSDKAPTLNSSGYWPGTNGDLTISSTIPGTVNVTVTRDASDSWSYEVVCVATAGTNTSTKITKTTGARVYVRNEYSTKHAASFNKDTTIPGNISVQGDAWGYKNFGITKGPPAAAVTGAVYCATPLTFPSSTYATPTGGWKVRPNTNAPAPSTVADLNLYTTYTIDDISYSADYITASAIGSVTKGTTAFNPAGVYIKTGDLELDADTVINGTLVVQGNVTIKGANIVITAQSNFPALIVTGTLEVYQSKNNLTVNGLCYVGTAIRANGSTPGSAADISRLTIDGALLMGQTSVANFTWTHSYNVITTLKYSAAKAKAPELTPLQRSAKGVSIVRWGLP